MREAANDNDAIRWTYIDDRHLTVELVRSSLLEIRTARAAYGKLTLAVTASGILGADWLGSVNGEIAFGDTDLAQAQARLVRFAQTPAAMDLVGRETLRQRDLDEECRRRVRALGGNLNGPELATLVRSTKRRFRQRTAAV